jgi:predicted dehydrogenase
MATTTDDADRMIDAARNAGVVLHVAHNMRHIPGIVAARDAVVAGKIGDIVAVRASFGHSGPHDSWGSDATWFFDPALSGGGALIDLGIHIIDVVRFVTRLEATTVQAMTYGAGNVEDGGQLLTRFGNGASGFVQASWKVRPANDFSLQIFGTEGRLGLDERSSPRVRLASGGEEKLALPEIASHPCSDFVAAIEGRDVSGYSAGAEDGRAALAIVCAAYESARTGGTAEVG